MVPTLIIAIQTMTRDSRGNREIRDENNISWKPYGSYDNLYYCADKNFGEPTDDLLAHYIEDWGLVLLPQDNDPYVRDYYGILGDKRGK